MTAAVPSSARLARRTRHFGACCCPCVDLVRAELPYSQAGRTPRLMRRGRGDQRSPGGFVTPPSVNLGPSKRDHEVPKDQACAPRGPCHRSALTEDRFVSPLEERWGPGGGARGSSCPGPHPRARPQRLTAPESSRECAETQG